MIIRSALVLIISCAFMASLFMTQGAGAKDAKGKNPIVVMETSMGTIKIELYPDKAPVTVKNFLSYVNDKFFDNLIFHRVIPDFMIQGGGFTKEMARKEPGRAPIANEADNGLKNNKYTIAMARTSDVNSATSQFFINTKDNAFLNFTAKTPQGYGYAVFGKVIEGMETVDKIGIVKTTTKMGNADVPVEPVVILKAYELKEKQ